MKTFDKKPPFQDSVLGKKISGGRKRTYFIDVKKTRTDDLYIVMSENGMKPDGSIEKHKIFLYKEDLNRFLSAFNECANKIKELMPDYDFDQFDSRFDTFNTEFKGRAMDGADEEVSW